VLKYSIRDYEMLIKKYSYLDILTKESVAH